MQTPTELAAELRLPGFWGLPAGTTAAVINYFVLYKQDVVDIPSDQGANFVSAIAGFAAGAVVMVAVSLFTAPKPTADLQGLVYGTTSPGMEEPPVKGDDAWYRKPALLGWGAVILAAACYIPFSF
jgi:SSS family solute:Na+ symporter